MSPRTLAVASACLLAIAGWLAWLWQPERQVRLHTAHFLRAVGNRDSGRIEHFLARDYADRWGHDKAIVLEGLHEVFQQFLFLDVENAVTAVTMAGPTAEVQARVRLRGQGGAGAQMIMQKVNSLTEPFVFTWEMSGPRPWQWALRKVSQPALELEEP